MKLYGSKQMLWLNRDSGCGTVMIFMVLSACIYSVRCNTFHCHDIIRRKYSDVPL